MTLLIGWLLAGISVTTIMAQTVESQWLSNRANPNPKTKRVTDYGIGLGSAVIGIILLVFMLVLPLGPITEPLALISMGAIGLIFAWEMVFTERRKESRRRGDSEPPAAGE